MSFVRPEFLWLALLALPELAIGALRLPRFRASLEALVGPRARRRSSAAYAALATISTVSAALFVVSSALALSGAYWGARGVATERRGLEAAVVLDVSRSMEVRDMGGAGSSAQSRLEAARSAIGSLVRGAAEGLHEGTAFSLVAVKGSATLLVPMTEDLSAFERSLSYANPDTLTAPGTDLEKGLRAGIDSFSGSGAQGRVLFLFTDGGELSGSALRAVEAISEKKARLVVVGLGALGPAAVPGPDGKPLVGAKGPILSALEPRMLESLALAAGGRYISASDPSSLSALSSELGAAMGRGLRIEHERIDRSGLFALLALAFVSVSILASALSNARRPA